MKVNLGARYVCTLMTIMMMIPMMMVKMNLGTRYIRTLMTTPSVVAMLRSLKYSNWLKLRIYHVGDEMDNGVDICIVNKL